MNVWSKLMEQLMGGIKDEKISMSILVFFVFGLYYAYGWADNEFVKKTEFNELKNLIVQSDQNMDQKMDEHTEDFEITSASQLLRDLKLEQRIAKATGATETELIDIQEQIDAAGEYKSCLVSRLPNCEHLQSPE